MGLISRVSSRTWGMKSLLLRTAVRTNTYVTKGSIPLTIREANKLQDKFRLKDTADGISTQKAALVEACGNTDMALEMINGIPEEQLKDKWENPTMGWGSTADPMSNVAGWMKFKSAED